eukprot:12096448-Heterocapsa_arctica.AAC.1
MANNSLEALQAYCSTLDALVLRCHAEQPSEDQLRNKFYAQVKGVDAISCDIGGYDRMSDDEPNRCYRWLREAVDRAQDRWRAASHRTIYVASL